jgi:hypothetical protein
LESKFFPVRQCPGPWNSWSKGHPAWLKRAVQTLSQSTALRRDPVLGAHLWGVGMVANLGHPHEGAGGPRTPMVQAEPGLETRVVAGGSHL